MLSKQDMCANLKVTLWNGTTRMAHGKVVPFEDGRLTNRQGRYKFQVKGTGEVHITQLKYLERTWKVSLLLLFYHSTPFA